MLPLALAVSVAAGCTDGADRSGSGASTTTASTAAAASGDADTVAFCERARSFEGGITIDPQNPDPAEIGRTADALGELAAVAPEEVKSQFTSAAQLLGEYSDLMASVDLSDPAAVSDPDVQARLASIQERDSSLGSDLEEIARFIEDECAAGSVEGSTVPPEAGDRQTDDGQ